jgi:hypothetical protein
MFTYVIIAFILGMVVMDFMWAYKMGIPQAMWRRRKNRKTRI